jgi:hypothetical protein
MVLDQEFGITSQIDQEHVADLQLEIFSGTVISVRESRQSFRSEGRPGANPTPAKV